MSKIEISDRALKEAAERGVTAFLEVFTDKYLEVLGGEPAAETMKLLNGHQHTLLGYRFLRMELLDGGFVQLIQNGYGAYLFDNPFAKAMRIFGAVELSKLIYKAKEVFDANRADLERERTEAEFPDLCVDYEVFDDMDEEFLNIEEHTTAVIAKFVDDNPSEFGIIISD